MPFYIKKSLRVGPMRFNLSNSGVGASIGVSGLRIGTGPRGHYIHAGRGGLYYRASLSKGKKTRVESAAKGNLSKNPPVPVTIPSHDSTLGEFVEITSGNVENMTDESSESLLKDINDCYRRVSLFKWAAASAAVLVIWLWLSQKSDHLLSIALVCAAALVILYYVDKSRKTCVLFYDLEDATLDEFKNVCEAFEQLGRSNSIARVDEAAVVHDRKYHAGAGKVVKLNQIKLTYISPPCVTTNIPVPYMDAGKERLFFLPDRLLVYSGEAVGAVSYSDLKMKIESQQFIIDGSVPSDAKIVSRTWRYVNKKGGPDRRFKGNRELPVGLYEYLLLTSATGLREMFQFSKLGNAESFSRKVAALAKAFSALPTPRPALPVSQTMPD
ncbi:MAG: DUF4236 domain-containing protein [Ferrovibrio sp.]|uniref:DUF4236 domain-containing protein n=1 Tax=Ferrovibrio sp. TaxID=1917215 RepID=UPI00391B89A3